MEKIRIQKILSDAGICSRRKAEEYITGGRVELNGRRAELGDKADGNDIIKLDGERVRIPEKTRKKLYIMLNKPRGYVTTMSDELERKCVTDLLTGIEDRVYPVGRLDRNSEGMLIFTNDGAFANDIMHPSRHVSKTYRVTVRPSVSEEQLTKLSAGVEIDGRMTLPAKVEVIDEDAEKKRVVMNIVIREGRNRQVRKMCEAVGLEVARLRRTAIGPVKLGMLKPGAWRELTSEEIRALKNAVSK
ncbi:MAG: rRNA pseudouridine synthase [Oscillospiraceae bacterium]|nr:rRNA pseudouridine synthase [Oscillospiraceae bacterium]MBQ4312339.1 rRNA pseudouridine synthase [Oscillospiraceae bacterium]MCR5166055.1 rRNA pseudouridine synthase [Oscillospiraceae bacterium]